MTSFDLFVASISLAAARGVVALTHDAINAWCWLTNRCPGCFQKHEGEP